jgi:hypothetical protein
MASTLLSRPTRSAAGVPRSQTERLWLVGGAIVALLLLVVGWFFFISPQRGQTSDVRGQIDDARTQNTTLQGRINELRNQSKNIAKYRADLQAAQRALPSTSGVSDFVRSLQSLGSATSTSVSSLTVGQASDVSTLVGAAPSGAASGSAPSSAPSPSTPAPSPGAGGIGAAPAGGAKIFALDITAQVTGTPAALNQFLDQLQNVQPRAVLITSLTENSGTGTPNTTVQGTKLTGATTLQLSMQAFVAPTTPSENASLSAAAHS